MQRADRPESDAQRRLAREPPGALRKIGVFLAPIVVVTLAARGTAASGSIIFKTTAANDPREELRGPGDRILPAHRTFALQPGVAVLRVFIECPFAHVSVHIVKA